MVFYEAHDEDDPIPHSRDEYSMDSNMVFPSILSTFLRID